MAISAAEQTSIVRLVVGMFNAAPGATYLNSISSLYEANGHNLPAVATFLSGTAAFTSIYNTGLTSQDFATAFLTTLGLQDNTLANDYIVAKANSPEPRGNIILDAINLLESLPADATGLFDDARDLLNNKTEVALFFSVTNNNPETNLAALQAVLSTITSDHQSVIDAEFGIANPPQSFDLTINADNFTGGEGNDIFTATEALSTVDLILRPTLGGNDTLDGAGGFDVLNADMNSAFGLAAGDSPHISGIEQINFTVRNSGSVIIPGVNVAAIDFFHVTGVNEVNMNDSDFGAGLDIFNVQGPVNIGINGLAGDDSGDFDAYMDVEFAADALGSDTASQLVTIEDVTDAVLYIETDGDDVITSLNLQVVGGGDNDLALTVTDGGGFAGDYATLTDLTIGGDGNLVLRGYYDFGNFGDLVTLNSTGLSGDLTIEVAGDTNIESILTGVGDDFVAVHEGLFDGELAPVIDLGGGDNTLSIFDGEYDITDEDVNALDFSAATISNVQTLELNGTVDLKADTALDVSTIGGLNTLSVTGNFFANGGDGYTFELTGPETLTVDVGGEIDSLDLASIGILDLTMITGDGDLDLDSLTSDDITSLTLNSAGNAWVDLDGTEDNLVTLANVSVTAGDQVSLEMFGFEGIAASDGTVETGTINVTNVAINGGTFSGQILVSSESLPGGSLLVPISISGGDATSIATALAAAIEDVTGIAATSSGGEVTYTWDTVGDMGDITTQFIPSGLDTATVTADTPNQGTDAVTAVPGTGFEGLASVLVDSGSTAHVDIEDAFGAFTVAVTSGDDACVTLIDTGVTSVDVTASNADGDSADVDLVVVGAEGLLAVNVAADDVAHVWVEDAESLTSVTVAAGDDTGCNELDLINTDSVSLIDLSAITDNDNAVDGLGDQIGNAFIDVDVVDADFAGAVQILVGDEDLAFHMDGLDAVRETFTFVGSDTGEVTIDNGGGGLVDYGFLASVGGTGDRLDFSQMAGIDALDDLAITFNGTSSHITSLVDGVNVDITVVGADVSLDAFHFIF